MIINPKLIDDLAKTNEKIASLLRKLSENKEIELESILKEIDSIKEKKAKAKKKKLVPVDVDKKINSAISNFLELVPKEKKNNETDKVKRNLGITIGSFSELFPKNISKNSSGKSFKITLPKFPKISSQKSQIDFTRNDNDDFDIQEEKLKTLKSISSKLDLLKGSGKDEKKPEEKQETAFDKIKNLLAGSAVGGLIGKFGFKTVAKTVGKVASKVVMPIMGIIDLISRIKGGITDYNAAKLLGDNVKADGVIYKTVVGGFGDLFQGASGWIPFPLGPLLLGLGMFMKETSSDYDSVIADKSNKGIQDKQKAAYAMDRLDQGKKYGIVQLKPSTDLTWLYKDYDSDDWVPLLSSDGKPLSMLSGKDRIQQAGSDDKGVSKYKIQTANGLADLILENGKPKMKLGDTISEISPKKAGGNVKKDSTYLVGENGPEAFQTNETKSKNESELFKNTFSEINSSFKKIVSRINFEKFLQVFTPETLTYKLVNVTENIERGVGKLSKSGFQKLIDFSNVSKNPDDRFKTFINQVYTFEGGYVDSASDLGGKTKFGITHLTYDAYRIKHHLQTQDVSNLTKEEADEIYKENFWKGSGADKIADPKLAFAYFDAYIAGPQRAKRLLKLAGGDVNKFLDLRDTTWTAQAQRINPKTGVSQMANLSGWLNRDQTQREMFAETPQKEVEISSSNNIKTVEQPLSKRDADANFLINKVIPALAEHIKLNYGTE
jgi:hypothetical protein